jgi:hypothetical protein
MMASGVKLTGPWAAVRTMFNPMKFDQRTRKYLRRATAINAKKAESMIRKNIQSGVSPPNKPLTMAIKGSSKPLVDTGQGIFQAVTSTLVNYKTAFVGVLRTSESFNIALALHEGTEIKVTDSMRGLFWLLWLVSTGAVPSESLTGRAADLWKRMPGGWKPIRRSTKVIVIPSRPFIRQVFEDPKLSAFCLNNWHAAIRAAMTEVAKG